MQLGSTPRAASYNKVKLIRSIILAVLIVLGPSLLSANDLWTGTLKLAQKHKANIVMRFTADWCGPCKQMEQNVLSDKDVKALLGKYVVTVVDVDKNTELANKLGAPPIPLIVILDSDGRELRRTVGYKSKEQLIEFLKPLSSSER